MIGMHLAMLLASSHVLTDGCSDTDQTVVCSPSCTNVANGGSGCQTNNFLDPLHPPWTWTWQCACVSQGDPAHCEAWKIVGCGTWCYMVWQAVGCLNPEPCACSDLRIWTQPCYSYADCSNRPGYPTCANPWLDCEKRVGTVELPFTVTGYGPCCPE